MRKSEQKPSPARQNGAALLVLLALVVLAIVAVLAVRLSASAMASERSRANLAILAEVRGAIVAWSVQRGRITGTERPGELPCPDTNNDGFEEGSCAAGRLGRVPWRTLGIPEPRDSSGEILWYAPSGALRRYSMNPAPLNSNTRGDLAVRAADGVSVLRNDVVFALFAPGPPLSGQNRRNTAAACPTTGTAIPEINCAANYLDAYGGINNATNNGPFIAGDQSGSFNDQVDLETTDDFIRQIEHRVALEAKQLLTKYEAANGFLPFPAQHADAGCLDANYATNCTSDASVCRGRFPDSTEIVVLTNDWPTGERPDWFSYNVWGDSIYYAVGASRLAAVPANCSARQSIAGASHDAVLVMPGPSLGSALRPSPNLSDYLEDTENRDGWSGLAPDADRLVNPSLASNDRLYPYR